DGRAVTLDDQSRPVVAVNVLEHVDAIVHRIGEMRGGASRFAAADGSVIDDDHFFPGLRKQISGGQSGDSGPHDAYVGLRISVERGKCRDLEGAVPDRSGVSAWKAVVLGHDADSKSVNRRESGLDPHCRRCTNGMFVAAGTGRDRHYPWTSLDRKLPR